jgi:Ca2+-binding EF-hand superfamily protein
MKCMELMKKLGVQDPLKMETETLLARGDKESVRQAFQGLWEHCDVNNDGKVELEELRLKLSSEGGWSEAVASDYALQLMAGADSDGDGLISRAEWESFFHRMWSDEVTEHIDSTMEYLLFGAAAPVSTA